jgi:hypothetical protein
LSLTLKEEHRLRGFEKRGTEENILTYEEGRGRRLEKTA